jgi:ribosomal protein S9
MTENRSPLRKEGLLTRDSRMVERKKPGRSKGEKEIPVQQALIETAWQRK